MSPDTQQNLLYTIYFIVLHNYEAILYSLAIIASIAWCFWRPSRAKILIMWGCMILLFGFEFNKHIAQGLREQTRNSLITERQSYRIGYVVDKITLRLLPRGLPILGWLLIIAGVGLHLKKSRNNK